MIAAAPTKTRHINTIVLHSPDDGAMIEKVKRKQNLIHTDAPPKQKGKLQENKSICISYFLGFFCYISVTDHTQSRIYTLYFVNIVF